MQNHGWGRNVLQRATEIAAQGEVNYIPDILNELFFGPIILTCQYPIGGLKHFCFESFGWKKHATFFACGDPLPSGSLTGMGMAGPSI